MSTSTTPVSARRAATQARLADAAVTVFARKGVPGSTLEEICEEAGFTRGAFYSNFDSKDELCMAVLSRYAEKNLAALSSSLDFPDDGHEALHDRIHDIIALFASAVGSDPTTVVAILEITLEAARNPHLREAYQLVEATIAPALRTMVEQALRDHNVTTTISVADLIDVTRAVFDSRVLAAMASGRKADIDRMIEQLTTMVLTFIRPL
ncbi:TetR/AcrR family transcriptional regulator [Cutibacterium equinum]|uniref:TetR/AcrR family transcriptional regulator n=1 Tax=Cutibacterium equinum TaxID=3016342 RepID=A0ABY7QYC2_9ACTN|nr:TetR/AcrR family transcriptional regulator [Cutibacterium equinum]WCC80033.1 TetR/AcrR family transcriptional regulator [Cutibacterium equinum]